MTSEKANTRRTIDSVQIMELLKRFEDAVRATELPMDSYCVDWPAIKREYHQARQNLVDALQR